MADEPREIGGRPDPLGRAMFDHQRGEPGSLVYRDGERTREGHVADYYFEPRSEWDDGTVGLLERLAAHGGPFLDVGCGAGQHALWFQHRGLAVTAVDVSPGTVRAASARGVADASTMDMFDLAFHPDRFRTLYALGTQIGLGRSLAGVGELLAEFARVTDENGLAAIHNYDPDTLEGDLLGYRSDPRKGIAHRSFHFEYEPPGSGGRVVGRTLQFLLFGPDRLADAAVGTPWTVADVYAGENTYVALLEKE
ncbi:class I SAM-dependent methyltransferase [Saliphagus infecundisoli]|uniref:Class I SAM-dependent methyltransferase n=1 Tax=Saliphagus infecundisoli TaxID=1849069 RepID=A0ABD5QDK3_9EURY|nr:methyltransferase domain-containing protein [Saliphagus infecundisoli]